MSKPITPIKSYVALFITNDDHSIAEWFEIPTKDLTKELEDKIFSKGYGYGDYYEDEVKIKEVNMMDKLIEFLSK